MWRLKITTDTGETILSPVIVPNNPKHSYDCIEVLKVIANTGASMVKRIPSVIKWEFSR